MAILGPTFTLDALVECLVIGVGTMSGKSHKFHFLAPLFLFIVGVNCSFVMREYST